MCFLEKKVRVAAACIWEQAYAKKSYATVKNP